MLLHNVLQVQTAHLCYDIVGFVPVQAAHLCYDLMGVLQIQAAHLCYDIVGFAPFQAAYWVFCKFRQPIYAFMTSIT